MKQGQTIEAWIEEVCSLTTIDVPVFNEDIIVILTAGLPTLYETVIISLNAVDSNNLTLNFVITCLLNEESQQNLACSIVKPESEVKVNSEALAVIT
ncbi:hypothetical protein C0993_010345, partial [Termitomyces sp. T159_Od127]